MMSFPDQCSHCLKHLSGNKIVASTTSDATLSLDDVSARADRSGLRLINGIRITIITTRATAEYPATVSSSRSMVFLSSVAPTVIDEP